MYFISKNDFRNLNEKNQRPDYINQYKILMLFLIMTPKYNFKRAYKKTKTIRKNIKIKIKILINNSYIFKKINDIINLKVFPINKNSFIR